MHIEEIRASLPDMHEDRKGTVSFGISMAGATQTREVDPLTVTQRLQHERRWAGQAEAERDEMMRLAKDRFNTKAERQAWVYGELDRMYPPIVPPKTTMSCLAC